MPAAAFRSSTSVQNQSGSTASVSKPAGCVDGDLLTAFQATNLAGGSNPTPPTGWTDKSDGQVFNVGTCVLQRFERLASSEPASWTFNNASGGLGNFNVYVVCSSPGDTISDTALTANVGSSSTADPGVHSCPQANELILVAWAIGTNTSGVITPDGSFTALGEIGDNTIAMNAGYKSQAASGNTSNTGASLSASLAWAAILAAIPPTVDTLMAQACL